MEYFQILSCNNNLGNCCSDHALGGILSVIYNLIQVIQIVVPIILLIMVTINLIQLVMNPEDKKKISSLKNKFLAAVFVFIVPVIINAFMNIVDEDINILACINESKNIKVTSQAKYIQKDKKDKNKIISGEDDYEKGNKKTPSNPNGIVTPGQKITSGDAVVGDNGVKLRNNRYDGHASIIRKVDPQEVIAYAKSWTGKLTYEHGTKVQLQPNGTCDCSQFVYQVLKHFDVVESDSPSIYCSMWGSGAVKGSTLYSDPSKIVPGDVVYKYYSEGAQHVEIYLGNNRAIGCNAGSGVGEGGGVSSRFDTFIHLSAYD